MKLKIEQYSNSYNFYINEDVISQKQYDYIFKYLNFDKLDKNWVIFFQNKKIKKWFYETYKNSYHLGTIHNQSPLGYQWLKNNWGKGVFKLYVYYSDKQELKTIVNKRINIKLIRKKKK